MPKSLEGDSTIGKLLGRYETRCIKLPDFQRPFSWNKELISQFWTDLVRFREVRTKSPSASYFLGPIVLIDSTDTWNLLDGQQRLATATIAFAAIRDIASRLDPAIGSEATRLAFDVQSELMEKRGKPGVFSLTLGDLDEGYFRAAVKTFPPKTPLTKPLPSHKRIQGAYDFFVEKLTGQILNKATNDALTTLRATQDALSQMSVVGMVVKDQEEAADIFETLNSRGMRLSVPDLVLNLMLSLLKDKDLRESNRNQWYSMYRRLGRLDISRFLRHFWVSKNGDLKSEGLYKAIKEHLDNNGTKVVAFGDECTSECSTYVDILEENNTLGLDKHGARNLKGIIRGFRIQTAPPLLMAGKKCLEEREFPLLLNAILTTHVRYVLATNQDPLKVETRFYEAAKLIRESKSAGLSSKDVYERAIGVLRELKVTDEQMLDAAAGLIIESRTEANWLIDRLTSAFQSADQEGGGDKATLEHIFPLRAKIADWPNKADLDGLEWHLGNLTLLGDEKNNRAENKSFKVKSSLYYASSDLKITKELTEATKWDEEEILKRSRRLVTKMCELWPAL